MVFHMALLAFSSTYIVYTRLLHHQQAGGASPQDKKSLGPSASWEVVIPQFDHCGISLTAWCLLRDVTNLLYVKTDEMKLIRGEPNILPAPLWLPAVLHTNHHQ